MRITQEQKNRYQQLTGENADTIGLRYATPNPITGKEIIYTTGEIIRELSHDWYDNETSDDLIGGLSTVYIGDIDDDIDDDIPDIDYSYEGNPYLIIGYRLGRGDDYKEVRLQNPMVVNVL